MHACPLRFEPNVGQTDGKVNFLSRNRRFTLFLMPTEILIAPNLHAGNQKQPGPGSPADARQPAAASNGIVRLNFDDANPRADINGRWPLPGKSNYFLGKNPAGWHTDIETYQQVEYQDIYPGIQLLFYGRMGELEFDFVVATGADPASIRLSIDGIESMGLDEAGNLALKTAAGELYLHKPFIYQEDHGLISPIAGGFVLDAPGHVWLQIPGYDSNRPLVIDPRLQYATFLGGEGSDWALDMALDPDGNVIVTGETNSTNFPLKSRVRDDLLGSQDAFVTKFNPTLSAVIYSTYLGGIGPDGAEAIAVDKGGNVYITGATTSDDFPSTLGAYQSELQNPALVRGDAFVARIGERFVIPPLGLAWQLAIYLAVVFLAGLIFFGWRRIFPGR